MHADWIDLFASLNENGVRYLVIGGVAVALYGHERYTKDIDVWVEPTPDNAKRVMRALKQFGAPIAKLQASDFEDTDNFVVIGAEPYRIDFLMGPPGLDFAAAWPNRKKRVFNGAVINFVSLPDLLALKRAAGRVQDKRDIAALSKKAKAAPAGPAKRKKR